MRLVSAAVCVVVSQASLSPESTKTGRVDGEAGDEEDDRETFVVQLKDGQHRKYSDEVYDDKNVSDGEPRTTEDDQDSSIRDPRRVPPFHEPPAEVTTTKTSPEAAPTTSSSYKDWLPQNWSIWNKKWTWPSMKLW